MYIVPAKSSVTVNSLLVSLNGSMRGFKIKNPVYGNIYDVVVCTCLHVSDVPN